LIVSRACRGARVVTANLVNANLVTANLVTANLITDQRGLQAS
jgi:uncharacterized protein YjbI with pentapeptide repeats